MDEKSGLMRQIEAAQKLAKDLPEWKRVGVEVDASATTQPAAAEPHQNAKAVNLK